MSNHSSLPAQPRRHSPAAQPARSVEVERLLAAGHQQSHQRPAAVVACPPPRARPTNSQPSFSKCLGLAALLLTHAAAYLAGLQSGPPPRPLPSPDPELLMDCSLCQPPARPPTPPGVPSPPAHPPSPPPTPRPRSGRTTHASPLGSSTSLRPTTPGSRPRGEGGRPMLTSSCRRLPLTLTTDP
mgnify:CR=1 FL=1